MKKTKDQKKAQKKAPKQAFIPLIILIILLILASLAIYNSSTKQNIINKQLNQKLIKLENPIKLNNFSLNNLFDKNNIFSLKDLKNNQNKYSIINFFASWCVSCLAEHKILFELSKEESINLYGVAWHDFSDNAKEYLKKHKNPFHKTALDGKGKFGQIINLKSVPETIIIDNNGFIILQIKGIIDKNIKEEILEFIKNDKSNK